MKEDVKAKKKLNEISLPEWNNAEELVNEIQNHRVSEKIKNKIEAMREYVRLRKEQIEMVEKIANEGMEKYQEQYNELGKKLDKAVVDLDRL